MESLNLDADSLASVPLVVVSNLVLIMIGKCEDVNVYIINLLEKQMSSSSFLFFWGGVGGLDLYDGENYDWEM